MKPKNVIQAIVVLVFITDLAYAQMPQFTRIDTGTLVQEVVRGRGMYPVDIDQDGDLDLYIGNSTMKSLPGGGTGTNRPNLLYRNERNCNFTKITEGILAKKIYSENPGSNWGDFDNDGDWDLFNHGELFVNDGYGNIENTILISEKKEYCATWIDYDSDGYLDIFTNLLYLYYGSEAGNFMYKNNGDNSFSAVSVGAAGAEGIGESQSVAWADCDNDGDMDVFEANFCIARDLIPNKLYINEGDGAFSMINSDSPIVTDINGAGGGAWGDYDNDGDMDIYVVSLEHKANYLYKNKGDLIFEKEIIDPEESFEKFTYGSTWGDFNNDGHLDLFVGVVPADKLLGNQGSFKENLFFINNGDGTFSRITTGNIITDGAQATAANDIDNDGDLDLVITHGNLAPPFLTYIYTNDGNANHWMNFTCEGTTSNRSGIGTRIRVKAKIGGKDIWMTRELAQENGLHACNGARLHFGLGNAISADSVIIRWPSGIIETMVNIPADHFYRAVEDSALVIEYKATNYIQLSPGFTDVEFSETGESVPIDLKEHYKLIIGDTIPDIIGDTLEYVLHSNENPDAVNATLEGGVLTLNAGSKGGTSTIQVIASTGFTQRMDQFTVSSSVSTPSVQAKQSINIYPNPAKDIFNIELRDKGEYLIDISSTNGQFMHTEMLQGTSHQINLSSFQKGVYFITIRSEDLVTTRKVIKL